MCVCRSLGVGYGVCKDVMCLLFWDTYFITLYYINYHCRYIMICHPYSADRYCSKSRARKVIAGLAIAGILFNLPKFVEYRTVLVCVPLESATRIGYDLTDLGKLIK